MPTAPAAVSTTVASTAPTSRLEVAYPQDAAGRLALGPGATATVVIRNPTRAPAAFDVRGVGSITVGAGSAASGVVQPGSVWSVPLRAGPDIPGAAGADATVTVSDARGVLVVIPVLIS